MHLNNNIGNQTLPATPTVFITGSLTGGTGSGILIDMGYLVRQIIPDIKDIYGLFLIPKQPTSIRGYELMYGNTYGALKDLDHYNMIGNNYKEKWPNGYLKDEEVPPYELVQFISQDYKDGSPALRTLSGLYKMAGLNLFLNIAGIYEKRRERLVDAQGNSLIGKYGTFGLSAIQFPKDQIQDYISSQLSIALLQRLTNAQEYSRNGQKLQIIRGVIKKEMAIAFDEILTTAFEALNTVGATDLLREIDKDATRINRGANKGNPVDFIISQFTSMGNDNYHALVSNNIRTAQNIFIDSIYQQVDSALQSTENLYYAKYVLEDIVESIEKTLKYWKSIGISSQAQNWDNELRKLAIECTKNKYKTVFEQDSVLKDRMIAILELMKMHLAIRTLVDICKHVKEGRIKMEGTNYELPRLQYFEDLIRRLNGIIGKIDDTSTTISFTRRLNDIKGDINDTTLPILRVYPSNSFEAECEKAKATYNQKSGSSVRSMKEIIQQQNIFTYFKQKQVGRFNEEIYVDFIRAFRLKVDTLNCIEDFNVASYIQNHTTDSITTARRAINPFLKVDRTFSSNKSLPRFVIGDDLNEINDILAGFRDQNFNDFPDTVDGKAELLDLKNIIVFYDEKGNYNPLTDLTYIDLMQKAYENVPGDLADPNITKAMWTNNRNAYYY
jgi:hypothetical protein